MKTHDLTSLYMRLVKDELGPEYLPESDAEGDVSFTVPGLGKLYFLLEAEKDPEYVMLSLPNFTTSKALGMQENDLLRAVNAVNNQSKAAKVFIKEDSIALDEFRVTINIECFLAAPDQAPELALLRATFKRNISALLDGVRALFEHAKQRQRIEELA